MWSFCQIQHTLTWSLIQRAFYSYSMLCIKLLSSPHTKQLLAQCMHPQFNQNAKCCRIPSHNSIYLHHGLSLHSNMIKYEHANMHTFLQKKVNQILKISHMALHLLLCVTRTCMRKILHPGHPKQHVSLSSSVKRRRALLRQPCWTWRWVPGA